MNKRQLEVEKKKLAEEAQELKHLKAIYTKAGEDIAKKISISNGKIEVLLKNWDDLDDKEKSIYQSQIYQRDFQKSLQKQINGFLGDLNSGQYKSISKYLEGCYETGFLGAMYDLHGQGVPIISPIDQKKVIKAMHINSKISKKLYTKLGEDVDFLKKRIANNISRGIATADSYANISRNIANDSNVGFNRAMRITRTEGHRIQANSAFDAQLAAKDAGADIVKQWDSTLDGKTRTTHRQLDGQIRELEEPFEVGGMKAMYPADFGRAAEDVNCRCALLQRAKWALDDGEITKMNNFTKELETFDSPKSYDEFKKGFFSDGNVKYMNYVQQMEKKYKTKDFNKVLSSMTEREYKHYSNLLTNNPLFNTKNAEDIAKIRQLPEIKYETRLNGLNTAKDGTTLTQLGENEFTVTFAARESVEWDSISDRLQGWMRYFAPQRVNKPFLIAKGDYYVQPYVIGSNDYIERKEIAKSIGGKYLGTSWIRKYNAIWDIDFYQKDGKIIYTVGKANVKKKITHDSITSIVKVVKEREKIIGEALRKRNIRFSQLKARRGDDWVASMKEFHRIIGADDLPLVVDAAKYDAIKNPVLYRGIAPSSHLRNDITNDLSPKQMADGFFLDSKPFPSRGIYGDGIAYCAPSLEKIGAQYATANWRTDNGGKIIEFKLKEDAKVIKYEDALELFREISDSMESNLLFAKKQIGSLNKEVGKAMNALGYDAIIKDNGDNTGIPFYVILNRGALVTKEDWTTVTVTPDWYRKVRRKW